MEIRWSDSLILGVPTIDAQHRELVARVGTVVSAVDARPGDVGALLDFLGEYALSHFATEERLMGLHAYPESAASAHREAHQQFVRAFSGLRYDVDVEGMTRGIVDRIQKWMVGWLMEHILGMDHALAMWIRSAQVKGPPHAGTWLLPRADAIEVLAVAPRGSLARAGLKPGDFIVRVGGVTVAQLGVKVALGLLRDPVDGQVEVEFHPGADSAHLERRTVTRRRAAR
ncbi:MAG: hemerythrin domain-containing protein [Deltaproteobacteria bacterium]|nr:hemerythrin domain-containing protein [Deltaproteobacteria bacterium]